MAHVQHHGGGRNLPPKAETIEEAARRRLNRSPWNWLLLTPLLLTLFPWVYNRTEPRLFDIPFFYWYQMLVIPVGVLTTIVVYRATKGER
ncbi:MAG: DUF3311 domain-containing protein [Actinomycetota bacterium]|nr:DUF3311 domain-containing protein [Actinomycetota bacterium]